MAVDADTIKYLEDVRKGKPRKFVMITKGVKIVSLIVYKKGPVEKYKKLAKQEGKGQFFHGVIDGKGPAITCSLLRSDGYEKPPGKDVTLKEFLNNETGMKFKPVYAVVDELPQVDELDGEEDASPDSQTPTEEPTTETPGGGAAEFKTRLEALKPKLQQVLASQTSVSQEVKACAGEAAKQARSGDFQQGLATLAELEDLLNQGLAEIAEKDSGENEAKNAFAAHVKELLPRIKEAAGTPQGEQAKLRVSEAAVSAREGDFQRAEELLALAESELESAGPAADSAFDELWPAARDALQSAIRQVDGQLEQLQAKLRETDDPDVEAIANIGLNALTEDLQAPLMEAISEVSFATGAALPKAAAKAAKAAAAFQKQLDSEQILVCDENPFGVAVSIRSTLFPCVEKLQNALQLAA